jgi:hypothetical protein
MYRPQPRDLDPFGGRTPIDADAIQTITIRVDHKLLIAAPG